MKNLQMLIIMFVIVGLYSYPDVISAAQYYNPVVQQNPPLQYIPIVSTTSGSDSLVDAIKQYSDITNADVDRWNFLWLGWFNAVPALAIGGYSMKKSGEIAGRLFEHRPTWLPTPPEVLSTSEPWIAAAAIGAGVLSYKILYPRIRRGMLDKVQKFIDVCGRIAIAQQQVAQIPVEWSMEQPIAVCKALNNLEYQARLAAILLNKIGLNDPEVVNKIQFVNFYGNNLRNNKQTFAVYCSQLIQAEENELREELRRRGESAYVTGLEIKNKRNLLGIAKDGLQFAKDVVQTGRDIYYWTKENIVPLGLMATLGYYWSGSSTQ